ncbi:MAG: divalent-cation tolerance protein CutA [Acidobacteriota bacterium]
MSAIIVVTSVGGEELGNELARELVARRHAACVNMLPVVKSFYRWQGKICHDSEYLLIIKTMQSEYDAVAETIQELHSYDLPEILAFDIAKGDPRFLEWIASGLDKDADFEDESDLPDVD